MRAKHWQSAGVIVDHRPESHVARRDAFSTPRWLRLALLFLNLFIAQCLWAQTPTCTSEQPVATAVPATASTQRIYAFGVQNATNVLFPTWWNPGGQNDLQWLQGTNAGNGTWYVDVPLAQFDNGNPRFGSFETGVYMFNATNSNVLCGQGSWTRNSTSQPTSADSVFGFDANSRLVYLNEPNGSTGSYSYDNLGNLQNVIVSSAPQIDMLTPSQGVVGTLVTIAGDPPGQQGGGTIFPNGTITASFNGPTPASVTWIDAQHLQTTVPAGSHTGYVSVTFPGGVVSMSPTIFVVNNSTDAQGSQPVITGFSPGSAAQGNSVTVTGTTFNPVPGQTIVRLGATQVTPSTITDTSIAFAVPANQGSANIYVTTPYGTAVSSTPLAIPMTTNGFVSIAPTAALTIGGLPQTLNFSGAHTCASYTFSGQAANWLSLQFSAVTTTPAGASVNYILYGPNNLPVLNLNNQTYYVGGAPTVCGVTPPTSYSALVGSVSANSLSLHLPPLPSTGAYTLILDAGASYPVSTTAVLIADPTVAQGSSTTATVGVAGQSQRIQFTGIQGQLLIVGAYTSSVAPAGSSLTSTWLSPLGLAANSGPKSAALNDTSTLVRGAESESVLGMVLSGGGSVTGTAQITLGMSPTATVTVGGSAVPVSQTTKGKAFRLSLALNAGQAVTVALANVNAGSNGLAFTLFDPSGATFFGSDCPRDSSSRGCSFDFAGVYPDLPFPSFTGTYSLVLQANDTGSGYNGSASLSSDLTATLARSALTTVNLTARPGQTEKLSFPTTGAPMLLNVLNGTASPTGTGMWAWTYSSTSPSAFLQTNVINQTTFQYGALFWPNLSSNTTVQFAADSTTNGEVTEGFGPAATGSASAYLDQTISFMTVNPAGASNPAATTLALTANAGQGRQLQYTDSMNEGAILTLTNTTSSAAGSLQVVSYFAQNAAGTVWSSNWAGSHTSTNAPYCSIGATTCSLYLAPNSFGPYPVMLIVFPYTGVTGPNYGSLKQLPYTANIKFGATLTLFDEYSN